MLKLLRTEATRSFWRERSVSESSADLGDLCSWLCVPFETASKTRGCLGLHDANALTYLQETCWMPGVDGVVSLLQCLRKAMGNVCLRVCREDLG